MEVWGSSVDYLKSVDSPEGDEVKDEMLPIPFHLEAGGAQGEGVADLPAGDGDPAHLQPGPA